MSLNVQYALSMCTSILHRLYLCFLCTSIHMYSEVVESPVTAADGPVSSFSSPKLPLEWDQLQLVVHGEVSLVNGALYPPLLGD